METLPNLFFKKLKSMLAFDTHKRFFVFELLDLGFFFDFIYFSFVDLSVN